MHQFFILTLYINYLCINIIIHYIYIYYSFINLFNYMCVYREEKAKVQYLCGHRAMVATIRILVIVMDIQTVYIRYPFQVSLKLGML